MGQLNGPSLVFSCQPTQVLSNYPVSFLLNSGSQLIHQVPMTFICCQNRKLQKGFPRVDQNVHLAKTLGVTPHSAQGHRLQNKTKQKDYTANAGPWIQLSIKVAKTSGLQFFSFCPGWNQTLFSFLVHVFRTSSHISFILTRPPISSLLKTYGLGPHHAFLMGCLGGRLMNLFPIRHTARSKIGQKLVLSNLHLLFPCSLWPL